MKKLSLYCKIFYFVGITSFAEATIEQHNRTIPSLKTLSTKRVFDFKNDTEKKELNEKLMQGRVSLESISFDGLIVKDLDMSNMYLKGINFNGCEFINVKFTNSDLREATFEGSSFRDVDLCGAIIYSSNDVEVHEKGFKISDWNHEALLNQYSDLMKDAKMKQVNRKYKEVEKNLEKIRSLNKFFPALQLSLKNKKLERMDLSHANLKGANFSNSSLEKTDLSQANLQEASFFWCNLKEVNLSRANLQKAKFLLYNLGGADLTDANLQNASFLDMEYSSTLRGANLTQANLQNANLFQANLEEGNLQGAYLKGANLLLANLKGANFSEASLSNSYKIPSDYTDEELSTLYHNCNDNKVRTILKYIVDGKSLFLEDLRDKLACREEEGSKFFRYK